MIEFDNKLSFFESVKKYLLCMSSEGELLEPIKKEPMIIDDESIPTKSFYLKNGLRLLGIKPNFRVVAVYLNSPEELKYILEKASKEENIVIITNLSERYCKEYINKKRKNSNLLFGPQLVNKKGFNRKMFTINEGINENEPFKKKCIHVDRFNEFLNFAIRQEIAKALFKDFLELRAINFKSNPKQKSLMPFQYVDASKNIQIIFIESNSQMKNIHNISEETFVVKLKFIEDKDKRNNLTINVLDTPNGNNNKYNFIDIIEKTAIIKKIDIDALVPLAESFNTINGTFYIDDFLDLYKYRKFNKSRYPYDKESIVFKDHSLFKKPLSEEIEIGSRSAFENKNIFFSNYKQLNDPFDLLFRIPKKLILTPDDRIYANTYQQKSDHPFLTFCVTSKYDNILMWSHYGYSHTGTCVGYSMFDLIKAIESDKKCAICFYGKIKYSSTRPSFYLTKSLFRFIGINVAILMFNIISMFSKYRDWKYEDEYRFLILPSKGNEEEFKGGHLMPLNFKNLFLGCFFDDNYKIYFKNLGISYSQMKLSEDKYKLEI